MEITKFGIPREDAKKIVRGVAEGKYSLLTGAGFSLSATSSHPEQAEAPTSLQLAQLIAKHFSLTMTPSSAADLSAAYEDAVFKTKDQSRVYNYLRTVLTGLTPSWHAIIGEIPWRRFWTLNIDDLPQQILKNQNRKVRHIHFSDGYAPVSHQDNELQVVYLHGRLASNATSTEERKLIFSLPEYTEATRSPSSWHEAFFSDFSDQPIILCGASAVGEIDLSRTFRSGNQSKLARDFPSIAVVYNADEASKERFRDRLGLIPLDCSGQDFFEALISDVKVYLTDNPPIVAAGASAADARVLGAQFILLSDKRAALNSSARRHDFYSGDEPRWSDIQDGLDAQTMVSKDATNYIHESWKEGQTPVVIISGTAGSGKSSTLLRILKECRKFSDHGFLFRSEESIDVDAVARCISSTDKVVFGFDMAADYSLEISDLATALIRRGLTFAIIAADRSKRNRALKNDLWRTTPRILDQSRFNSSDAGALYHKRKLKHRLGSFTNASESAFRKFVTAAHSGNVFSAMATVEGGAGKGFEQRLNDFVRGDIGSSNLVALAHGVSLTHRWGYALPIRNASLVSGIDSMALAEMCGDTGEMSDVFSLSDKGISFRHRVLASHFFDSRRDFSSRKEVLVQLISQLAPLVTVASIRAKTYTHLVCRAITRREAVLDAVGNIDAARQVYTDVEPSFGHNSRFWEQRALLESSAGDHSKAYSYAQEAVFREQHAFPFTTLGRVCMSQAISLGAENPRMALERFKEGNAALLQAKSVARRSELVAHPFTAFFYYAEKFLPFSRQVPGGEHFLKDEWSDWMKQAKRNKILEEQELMAAEKNWLIACTS